MKKRVLFLALFLSVFTNPFIYGQRLLKLTEKENRIGAGIGMFSKSRFLTYNAVFQRFSHRLGSFDVGLQAGWSYGDGWDFSTGSKDTDAPALGKQSPSGFFTLNAGLVFKKEFSKNLKHHVGISLSVLPAYTRFSGSNLISVEPIFINGQLRGGSVTSSSYEDKKFNVIIPLNLFYDWRISKKVSIGLMPTYYWMGGNHSNIVLKLFCTF